jgi:hypothetical protein
MNVIFKADSTTLVLNGTIIGDFSEGDTITLEGVNPTTSHQNGSNGTVIIKKRIDSDVADLTVNVIKYSESDIFLNSALNQDVPVVFNGSIKDTFVRDGSEGVENWILENGSLTDKPSYAYNNQDGNAVLEYKLRFRSATRML